jgi:hypothetical protein
MAAMGLLRGLGDQRNDHRRCYNDNNGFHITPDADSATA